MFLYTQYILINLPEMKENLPDDASMKFTTSMLQQSPDNEVATCYTACALHILDKQKAVYRKDPKNSDTQKNCCNYPKTGTVLFYYRVMGPNDAERMANSVDPDQTAPRRLGIITV